MQSNDQLMPEAVEREIKDHLGLVAEMTREFTSSLDFAVVEQSALERIANYVGAEPRFKMLQGLEASGRFAELELFRDFKCEVGVGQSMALAQHRQSRTYSGAGYNRPSIDVYEQFERFVPRNLCKFFKGAGQNKFFHNHELAAGVAGVEKIARACKTDGLDVAKQSFEPEDAARVNIDDGLKRDVQ